MNTNTNFTTTFLTRHDGVGTIYQGVIRRLEHGENIVYAVIESIDERKMKRAVAKELKTLKEQA